MIFLRSLIFNVLFYLPLVSVLIVALPTLSAAALGASDGAGGAWADTSLFLMRVICNIRIEFRGVEKIPQGRCSLPRSISRCGKPSRCVRFFEQPLFILKRELMWIPVFGWFLKKAHMISVDRGGGAARC